VPAHVPLPQSPPGLLPLASPQHVPTCPARLHAQHLVVHAPSQHTPSAQYPVRQSVPSEHPCPCVVLHPPAPSQALPPVHVPSVNPHGTLAHVPRLPETLHAWHVPVHEVAQHTPSTHRFDRHSLAPTHVWPFCFLQLPAPSHASGATHAPAGWLSCVPAGVTLPQVPVAHVLHAAVHASLQHFPSLQNPEAHSPAPLHVCVLLFLHPPAPSQALGATQAPSIWSAGTGLHVPTAPATLQA